MQRFTVVLFAIVAILAVAFPAVVDAKSAGVRRIDTNADRLRRGEGLIPPSSINKRHNPSRVEAAKRHQPSQGSGSPPGGSVQCRGGDGQTIGYIGDNGNVKRGSNSGTSCSWWGSTGKISFGSGKSSWLGARSGHSWSSSLTIGLSVNLTEEECAVVWDYESSTGKLSPSYVDNSGNKTPCGVTLEDNTGALKFHKDVNVAGGVSLHLI